MKKILFTLLVVALTTTIASADILVGDVVANTITRYTDAGAAVWTNTSGRSTSDFTMGRNNDMAYISKQGVDKLLTTINLDGTYTDERYNLGLNTVSSAWLDVDLNGDGKNEMVVTGRDYMDIVSVDDTDIFNITYTTLGSYLVADSDVASQDGTGGKAFASGKDYNGDGINDMIIAKGGNYAGGRINIYDPTDGSQIASYNADETRGIGAAIWGADQNADGIEDLWVTDAYRNSIRAYDPANNFAYIGVVDLGFAMRFPNDMIELDDGTVYISTRFGTGLSAYGLASAYGNVVKWDPVNGGSLELEVAGGNLSAVMYIPEPATMVILSLGGLFLRRWKK